MWIELYIFCWVQESGTGSATAPSQTYEFRTAVLHVVRWVEVWGHASSRAGC